MKIIRCVHIISCHRTSTILKSFYGQYLLYVHSMDYLESYLSYTTYVVYDAEPKPHLLGEYLESFYGLLEYCIPRKIRVFCLPSALDAYFSLPEDMYLKSTPCISISDLDEIEHPYVYYKIKYRGKACCPYDLFSLSERVLFCIHNLLPKYATIYVYTAGSCLESYPYRDSSMENELLDYEKRYSTYLKSKLPIFLISDNSVYLLHQKQKYSHLMLIEHRDPWIRALIEFHRLSTSEKVYCPFPSALCRMAEHRAFCRKN